MIGRRQALLGAGALLLAPAPARAETRIAADEMEILLNLGSDLSTAQFAGVQRPLHPLMYENTSLAVLNAILGTANRVVLENLPSISTQGVPGHIGAPGSCEAQSYGYCLGSYTAARRPNGAQKWDASLAQNQVSAAWLYHWQHVDDGSLECPAGSKCVPYAQKLVRTGAPSTQAFPDNPTGATTVAAVCANIETYNVATTPHGAERLIVGSYKAFNGIQNQKAQYLDTFKALLRNGHAIAFSGLVAKTVYCVMQPTLTNGVFTAPDGFAPNSGHGQVIVGFDDSKGANGAFLVQNSFGPGWNPGPVNNPGCNGRIWWDYDTWFSSQVCALIMFPNNLEPPRGVRLTTLAAGAPAVVVKESKRYRERGLAYLNLILHASDAITLNGISVVGPRGATTTQAVTEVIRFGYVYLERQQEFLPGRYRLSVNAMLANGAAAVFEGELNVT